MADQLYSKNQTTNPGAETGNLAGWTATNVTVVDGGTPATDPNTSGGTLAPSTKCFQFGTDSSLEQVVTPAKQPPECLASADFLPEIEADPQVTAVQAFVRVVYEYADGTSDTAIIPCKPVPEGVS